MFRHKIHRSVYKYGTQLCVGGSLRDNVGFVTLGSQCRANLRCLRARVEVARLALLVVCQQTVNTVWNEISNEKHSSCLLKSGI